MLDCDHNKDQNLRIFCNSVSENGYMGKKIYHFSEVESTNNEAKKNSHLQSGTVFIADRQTKGKARLGRQWISDCGGLSMSVLLKPDITPEKAGLLTLVCGLAASSVIDRCMIKWPNDLVLENKKIGGILCEMSKDDEGKMYVVLGIGINLNTKSFPADIANKATSVFLNTGMNTDKSVFVSKLLESLEKYYQIFLNKGFDVLLDEYKGKCVTLNKEVVVHTENGIEEAFATDILPTGELVVKCLSGVKNITSGEASVRGVFGYI